MGVGVVEAVATGEAVHVAVGVTGVGVEVTKSVGVNVSVRGIAVGTAVPPLTQAESSHPNMTSENNLPVLGLRT